MVAFAVAVVVAIALSATVAGRLGTRRPVAALLLFGFGLVVAATLMPTARALGGDPSDGVCDFSRMGFAPPVEFRYVTSASLNVLLFVPLGLAVGLLPRTRAAGFATLAAISLTFIVETVQLLVTPLGRGCQSADVFDNLSGPGDRCGRRHARPSMVQTVSEAAPSRDAPAGSL